MRGLVVYSYFPSRPTQKNNSILGTHPKSNDKIISATNSNFNADPTPTHLPSNRAFSPHQTFQTHKPSKKPFCETHNEPPMKSQGSNTMQNSTRIRRITQPPSLPSISIHDLL